MVAKWLNIEYHEDVARNTKDFVKRLAKTLYGREAADAFNAGRAHNCGIVDVLLKTQGQFVG